MINNAQFEITCDFDKFKNGLVNRIMNNYHDTCERQQVINKIPNVTMEQAIHDNAFCKEIFPILWNASPPQNEKDYCYNSKTVCVYIFEKGCGYNRLLRVKSYFHGNIRGNPIKGKMLQSEVDKIENNNIEDIIKESASRKVLEETNINLVFIDDYNCSLSLYNNIIIGKYEITNDYNKHHMVIQLSTNNYELLKEYFHDNLEEHKKFMENTGEISGLLL
jgi:hypothetical protein